MGHFARDCPQCQVQSQGHISEWTKQVPLPDKFPINDTLTAAPTEDRVSAAKAYFTALTKEERMQVADELGNALDFLLRSWLWTPTDYLFLLSNLSTFYLTT